MQLNAMNMEIINDINFENEGRWVLIQEDNSIGNNIHFNY